MDNLKNLSMAELNDLEKAIKAEKDKRGATYKTELFSSYEFLKEFDEDVKKKGVTYENWYFNYDRSIFKICDITLGNYQAKPRKSTNMKRTIVNNGAVIDYGDVDPKAYKAMIDDLWAVIQKHHKLNLKGEKQ